MLKGILLLSGVLFLFGACGKPVSQQAASHGLKKIHYRSEADLQRLRQAGARIIVQQPDYVIIDNDSLITALGFKAEPIQEKDLVQRLVRIVAANRDELQKAIDIGVDPWEVHGDTLIARAYDLYIEQLRKSGLTVEIIAQDASKWEGKQ
ncbi:MAG: hypothetical protein D6814_00630 [Calditrichaeota bacterium]|nr:MAG: hypothetical protein D6814_00630 [Calditrichota bacterium]